MPGEQEFDVGPGTLGTATMRMLIDGAQLVNKGISDTVGSVPVVQAKNTPFFVPPSSGYLIGAGGGALGDVMTGVWIIPTGTTLSPGSVVLQDGVLTAITLFAGGTNSISNAVPWLMALGMQSVSGAWHIATGAGVSALALGKFT